MPKMLHRVLTDEQRRLVEENVGLARRAAWKYRKSCALYGMDWDDAYSIACLGLIQAALTYDPEKGAPTTYLTCGCESQILRELRRYRVEKRAKMRTVSLDAPIYDCGNGAPILGETLAAEGLGVEEEVLSKISAYEIVNGLSSTDRAIFDMRMAGKKQKDIARRLSCTQSGISRRLKKMLERHLEVML